jgi:uncharacterized protein
MSASSEHPNVVLVRKGFEAFDKGDLQATIDLYAPDVQYSGYEATGHRREFTSRDELFGMFMEVMAVMDEMETELLDAYAVGDSIVMTRVRGHRRVRATKEVLDTEFVMVFRIANGQVSHGVDLIDENTESFYKNLAATAA